MADFKEKHKECTIELLGLSVGENTPYKIMVDFFDQKFDEYKIPEEKRIQFFANMLPSMIMSFTTSAMQLALDLAYKHLTFETELQGLQKQNQALDENIKGIQEQTRNTRLKNDELEEQKELRRQGLEKQNLLLDAQIQKLKDETALAKSQQKAIDRQVVDNRLIKVSSILKDSVSENHAGGMVVPAEMIKYFLDVLHYTIKDDVQNINKPSNYTMTKK
ncbi:hypothetical protein [Campylobacter sp. RM16192]|uniref:hypothetical protein n=1 Tax=Campylobacter sp. RM16192 TaxID=1660080 RepID=UPI0014518F8C|nr:hypothetical protein [Campylobacter sp. RM16192]QCD52789.1 hypothetical protein CDOMC_1182 [Campylobacter sp. RM16192]